MAKLKEMHSIGGMELNPDAEDFIPGNQQPRHLSLRNWARPEVHRNRTNNLPSARQQKFHRDYQHEHIQKRNSYNCPRNNFRAPVVCPEGQNNRNSANHSFQNQRRHRVIKHERPWDSDRDQIKQDSYKVVEGAEGPEENETFHCAASAEQNVAEKERPELALESERETNTDKHGARPKKINQPTYGSGRFSNDRGKLGLSRDIRTGEKWKEMPESTLAAGFTQLSTSGFVQDPPGKHQKPANYNEPKTHCYFGAKNVRESTWNQYNSDRESHRKQAFQHSKTEKGEKNISYTAISKPEVNKERETRPFSDKGPDLSSRSMTYRRAEAEKMSGHQHQPWDGLKKSFQSPRKPLWRKQMEVHKSKETHTGSLIEQLTSEKYECMVCCEIVRMMAPVWSCQNCYHVFHLNCIKKWARSPASQAEAEGNDGWRCPACQNVSARVPSSYTCFCGKVTNPEWNRNEIPHSCGELCGKKRSGMDCPHPCNILCHPGPCPPCPAFVTKACECGKTSQSVRCGHLGAIRCSSICDSLLNCGKHTCAVLCHAGKCQPCSVIVQQVCYCGTSSREVPCGTDKEHYDGTGYFSCHKPCGSKLNCGKHECIQECHPRPCLPCPRLPHIIRTCPCGQTSLAKLLELGCSERKSCTDPIPSCGKTCGKPLLCGSDDFVHTCENLCHEGECGSCSRTSTVSCRCGFRTKEIPCADIKNKAELTFMCDKRCSKKRLCGRHKCNEICCVDKEHKCSLICGRKLNCGLHRCEEPCHRGNCQTCWQTSFDELTCHCGETVIYPPVPCGTKPPECKNICTRHHECSHPVFHNCHSEEKCPPCTYLMKKWCMGKHEERNNIPCHLSDISCGLQCQKLLPCGMHKCKRICHKGDCITDVPCTQPCITPRSCGHPCEEPCHPRSPCPGKPCKAKVLLTCNCGHRKENMICCEASSTCQRIAAIAVASKLSDTQLGDSVEISRLVNNKEMKQARLQCNEECAALERNRRLAEALSIDTNSDPFNVRFTNSKYSDSLKEEARKDIKFLTEVEEEMRALVESVNKGKQTKRSHCFPPMKRDHRKLIHDLAEIYGIESVSYDSEPKRNVVVTAVKGRSSCPNPSLTTVIERDQQMRPPPPIAHHKQATKNSSCTTSTIQKVLKEEPLIDYFDVQD